MCGLNANEGTLLFQQFFTHFFKIIVDKRKALLYNIGDLYDKYKTTNERLTTMNEIIDVVDDGALPVQQAQKSIDEEIQTISDRLLAGSNNMEDDLRRLNYLQRVKNSLRYASLNEQYDSVVRVVLDRFNNDFPTFTNRELLEYATQLQQIMDSTRKSANDDLSSLPLILQNNTQINIQSTELDRASKERVADVVRAILKDSAKEN